MTDRNRDRDRSDRDDNKNDVELVVLDEDDEAGLENAIENSSVATRRDNESNR